MTLRNGSFQSFPCLKSNGRTCVNTGEWSRASPLKCHFFLSSLGQLSLDAQSHVAGCSGLVSEGAHRPARRLMRLRRRMRGGRSPRPFRWFPPEGPRGDPSVLFASCRQGHGAERSGYVWDVGRPELSPAGTHPKACANCLFPTCFYRCRIESHFHDYRL